MIERICIVCNKKFLIYPSILKYGKGLFCSKKCYGKWQILNRRNEKARGWKGGKVICWCKYCGKTFFVYPSVIEQGRGIFCSKECFTNYIHNENNPNWKGKIKRICKTCGKEFECYPAHATDKQGLFCSQSCARKDKKIPKYHTKPERIFEEICKKHNLPFKYTGDGSFWVENINPDFVNCNGKKIAIEVFGDYWHSPLLRWDIGYNQTYEGRMKIFKKYGWGLVILWEADIMRKDAEAFILNKIQEFK